ncbi:MAG TPA: type I-E CRISPR-associated protein Cas6/Cse3/CasE [Terrimesophilobacter sp.]|nr:type I-E CRISPR-associated protein Cas6/Cse3/CasE [Terrimesophilobacter sp.]HRP99721.1 type I-E CRISPR-associated protein Cas6/Cse3/CasE [Terrimesophilobacter sp.]
MYFTRMLLNSARRGTRFLQASPHALHAAVLAGFPPGVRTVSDEGRVLWRLDRRGHELALYVVSPESPDLTHLIEQAGWPLSSTWQTREYSPFLNQLARGQQYVFRLTANPVRQPRDPELSGKRVGHVTVAQQEQWLLDRAGACGLAVREATDTSRELAVSEREVKKFARGKSVVTLSTARFDGALEVTDEALLRASLTKGIGPAKGYGCGLMTLARV